MPLYEYHCDDCSHDFEVLQRLGDTAAGLACPECGAEELEKKYSTFASASGKPAAPSAMAPAGGCCQGTLT